MPKSAKQRTCRPARILCDQIAASKRANHDDANESVPSDTGNVHRHNVNVFEAKPIQRGMHQHSLSPTTPNSDPLALTTIQHGFVPATGTDWSNEAERKFPRRDGSVERDHDACARPVFVNTSSTPPQQIMRADLKSCLASNERNSRRYAQVSISIYAFMASGKRGASSSLGNVKKVLHGGRAGGTMPAPSFLGTVALACFLKRIVTFHRRTWLKPGRPYTALSDVELLLVGYSMVRAPWNSSVLAPAITFPTERVSRRLSPIGTEGSGVVPLRSRGSPVTASRRCP